MTHQVFISYSTKDKAQALAVCTSLESHGVQCWIAPRDIIAGEKWAEAIAQAIESSAAFALILSQSSNASSIVEDEVNLAKTFVVPIVSVRVESVEPAGGLKLLLASSHWFEAHPPPLDSHLDQLARNLQDLLRGSRRNSEQETKRAQETKRKQNDDRRRESAQRPPAEPPPAQPPPDSSLHRELLFGVVAAQFDFITQEQFLAVCADWCATKSRPLGELLVDRKWIDEADRAAIEALHQRKLARHQGDAPAALRASADGLMRDVIRQSQSPEVRKSVDGLPPASGEDDDNDPFEKISRQSRYEWIRLHRAGGLGHIWIANDNELGRPAAIKALPPDKRSADARRMLLHEARITSRLEHPNIVPVYEVGRRTGDDEPYYAMRLLRGETLTEIIEKFHAAANGGRPDSVERRRLLNILWDVCNAVAYAHSEGVAHLDIKPDNIVVGMFNEVSLLDWGLARELGKEDGAPQHPRGTPAYMAPEQAGNDVPQQGPRTDVYGLGAVLFEILTGRPPHAGGDTDEVLQRIATRPSPAPTEYTEHAPDALVEVCQRAMAAEPAARHDNALALAEQIQAFLRDEPLQAYRTAVKTARSLCEKNPDSEAYRDNLARALVNLGIVLAGMERHEEAEQQLAEAVETHRWLKKHFADNLQYRVNFAAACLERHTALAALGRHNEAQQMRRDALWEYEDIIRRSPKKDDFVSIYESIMLDVAESSATVASAEEKALERQDQTTGGESEDGSTLREKESGLRPADRWVVPESLYGLLFAVVAIREGVIDVAQLHLAVSQMLNDQSLSLEEALQRGGQLDGSQRDQVQAAVRAILKASNAAPRASRLEDSDVILETTSVTWRPTPHEAGGPGGAVIEEEEEDRPSTMHPPLTTGRIREDSSAEPHAFTDISRFQIVRTLGQGGWGRVSLARDLEAYRYVALKELGERNFDDGEMKQRFLNEARFAASIQFSATPPVYAIGQFPDGRPFYAMYYVDGDSIDNLLRRNRDRQGRSEQSDSSSAPGEPDNAERQATRPEFTLNDAIRSLVRVARCLDAAHSLGFVHRDVKPKHILVDKRGETYFTDWGLVKCLPAARRHPDPMVAALAEFAPEERDGMVVGTPAFMSPEQISAQEVGPASDIYSLGATLYLLLAGRTPHQGPYSEIFRRVAAGEEVRPPSEVAGELSVPAELETICLRAMATRPVDRFATANDMADALEQWL